MCVEEFSDGIFRFILKNIKVRDKAEDIVQDTFEKLWTRVDNVSFGKAKSYLFTTAYHTMIDRIRKEKKQTDMEKIDPIEFSHAQQYSDLNEILHAAIDKLPEVQRSVVLLRDYEGYSYSEIAEITGLNETQVKVYIFRARTFLKEYIGSVETVL